MLRKGLLAVLALAVLAGLIALIVVLTANPPEKTVGRFFKAIEKRDEAALAETLSTDPGEVALLAQTLSPRAPAMVKVFLKDGITDKDLESLIESVRAMPEVTGIIYAPNSRVGFKGIAGSDQPPGLDVTINDPQNFRAVATRLASRPEIRIDPATKKQDIVFPVGEAVHAFMRRVLPGIRFSDLKYKTTTQSDSATVVILEGNILKLNEKGERVPVDAKEFEGLGVFPIGYTLKNVDGRWVITSFPNVQVQE